MEILIYSQYFGKYGGGIYEIRQDGELVRDFEFVGGKGRRSTRKDTLDLAKTWVRGMYGIVDPIVIDGGIKPFAREFVTSRNVS